MIKKIIILVSIVLLMINCKTRPRIDKRKELIQKFVLAVKDYDTVQLYSLIDTSRYFKIQDRDGLLYEINYVNEQFKLCENKIIDSSIKIREKPVSSKEYIVPFCRGKNGEVIYGISFDMLFTFADFDSDEKIDYWEVVKYRQGQPTIPPPR